MSAGSKGNDLIVYAVLLLVGIGLVACSSPEPFHGTELTSAEIASPFQLEDQFGQTVTLADHSGKVVLLTFLYTNCPDICPTATSQIRDAYRLLGRDASSVAFLAVSVDPERDSVEDAYSYSLKWDMLDKWGFLVGTREQLRPIWTAYYIDPASDHEAGVHDHQSTAEIQDDSGSVAGLSQDIVERYLVSHSTPVYLIDPEGRMRVLSTPPLDPEGIAHDIRLLLD